MKQVNKMTEFEKLLEMARNGENLDTLVHHDLKMFVQLWQHMGVNKI